MARSKTYKLLLCTDASFDRFYDLVEDPLELQNVYGDRSCTGIREELRTALLRWSLFVSCTGTCLDEYAPVIEGPGSRSEGRGVVGDVRLLCRQDE